MIHELYSSYFSQKDQTSLLKKEAVERADTVICISKSTKNDLLKTLKIPENKITVVHLGFDKLSLKEETESDQQFKPYLLYVGNRHGYKNFNGLIKAYASSSKLKNDFDIVAFGGRQFNPREIELFSKHGLNSNQVRHLNGDDTHLGKLYRMARAFVYPSIYEGFGLPPLEAMANLCPVISSNTSSMPEVIGEAGRFFDPLDVEQIREAIESTVYSDKAINDLIQAGTKRLEHFSWKKCCEQTLAIYQKAASL